MRRQPDISFSGSTQDGKSMSWSRQKGSHDLYEIKSGKTLR